MAFKKEGGKSPDIIVTFKFETPTTTESYARYAEYTDREEAVLKSMAETAFDEHFDDQDYKKMIGYMKRESAIVKKDEARTGLFNQESLNITEEEMDQLKEKLDNAQLYGNNLWNSAISFDCEYLAKIGVLEYDEQLEEQIAQADQKKKALESEKTKNSKQIYLAKKELEMLAKQRVVNQEKLKTVVQENMPSFLRAENFGPDAFWWGSVHMNTRHVHLHVSISEELNSRPLIEVEKEINGQRIKIKEPRGKFKVKNMERLKSRIYHDLDIDKHKKVRKMREMEVGYRREKIFQHVSSLSTEELSPVLDFYLRTAYQKLPKEGNWRFGSNAQAFKEAKVHLSAFIDHYLNSILKEEYEQFTKAIEAQLSEYKKVYSSDDSKIKEAIQKRQNTLKEALGNKILKALKENPPEERIEGKAEDFLSVEDWKKVVEDLKKGKLSPKQLGKYKHLLRISIAESEEIGLKMKLQKLNQFETLEGNKTLKDFLQTGFQERIQLARFIQRPRYFLTDEEKESYQQLKNKHLSPRNLEIKKALSPFVFEQIEVLDVEKELLKKTKDTELIKRLYQSTPKEAIKDLTTQQTILKLKQQIAHNNEQGKRKENSELFKKLKKLYGENEPKQHSKAQPKFLKQVLKKIETSIKSENKKTHHSSQSSSKHGKSPKDLLSKEADKSFKYLGRILNAISSGESEMKRAAQQKRQTDREEEREGKRR